MLKAMDVGGKFFGFTETWENKFFFFGSRNATREAIEKAFPQYQFAYLKQVHGRSVLEADPDQTLEGDSHYTIQPRVAVVAQSADCVPILLASKDMVCAIHAGWRGVALNIVSSVRETLPDFHPLAARIGPHIRQKSFEVGADIADQLMKAGPPGPHNWIQPGSSPDKVFFDLHGLVRAQLETTFGKTVNLEDCSEDTKTNPLFHSYRRDGAGAGRQFSFVVINH